MVGGEISLDAVVGQHQFAARFRRIENQAIEPRRAVQDLVRERPDLLHPAEVRDRQLEVGIRYVAADSVRRGLAPLGRTCTHQDPRPAFGELHCDGLTEAARRASHQEGGPVFRAGRLISHRWERFLPISIMGWVIEVLLT